MDSEGRRDLTQNRVIIKYSHPEDTIIRVSCMLSGLQGQNQT